MDKRRNYILAVFLCSLWLAGCDRGGITLDGEAVNGVQVLSEEAADEEVSAESEPVSKSKQEDETEADSKAEVKAAELTVHVCGAVNVPGVYVLKAGARLYEAIEMAGGFAGEAAEEYLNLASPLADGMQIAVPTAEEVRNMPAEAGGSSPVGIRTADEAAGSLEKSREDGRVNINTAGKAELMTLPGIGESRAEAIISYREQNGKFRSEEELMNVTGIKEASYGKLEQYITVLE